MSDPEDTPQWGDGAPVALQNLIAENVRLKRKLKVPVEQRILEEVMSREVHSLLQESIRKVAQSENLVGAIPPSAQGDEASAAVADEVRQTLSETLKALSGEKEAAERRLAEVLANTVGPLQQQLTDLEKERTALRGRVGELEMTMANQSPPAFMAELEGLRKSESLYRSQLSDMQNEEEGAVAKVKSILSEGLTAARALPDYAEALERLKEALRESRATQQFLRVELEEQAARTSLLEELAKQRNEDDRSRLKEEVQVREDQLREAAAREETLESEKQELEEQVRRLQEENVRLSTQTTSAEDTARAKRQRIEEECANSSHTPSVRLDFIRFWYEGHDTIEDLERKVSERENAIRDLRVAQGRVAQLERAKEVTLGHLASVAQEVTRLREESQEQRAQIAGLEVERDQLLRVVASTVGENMTTAELQQCCDTIREAARSQAAASAAIVTDPDALRQAVRRAQELKNEVAVLQKQKEKLTYYIRIQEERVKALLEQHALTSVKHPKPKSGAANTSESSAGGKAVGAGITLSQFLESVLSSAKDILWESENAALGLLDDRTALEEAMSRHKDLFVALQARLQESQSTLLSSQRRLQESLRDNIAGEARFKETQANLGGMIEAKDAAVQALQEANAALLQRVSVTSSQKQEMRRQLEAMASFADHMLRAFTGVFGLFQKEVSHVQDLRRLVAQEREEMMELVRHGSSGTGGPDISAVTTGLERLAGFIQTAIEQNNLAGEEERTEFLKKLVGVLQSQEARVAELQKGFMEASQAQAASVAERIAEAQKNWESTWKTRCEATEAHRDQIASVSLSNQTLLRALEGAAVEVPRDSRDNTTGPPAAPSDATEISSSATTRSTLAAIDAFIERARQQLAARAAATPAPSLVPVPPVAQAPAPAPPPPATAPATMEEPAAAPASLTHSPDQPQTQPEEKSPFMEERDEENHEHLAEQQGPEVRSGGEDPKPEEEEEEEEASADTAPMKAEPESEPGQGGDEKEGENEETEHVSES